MESDLPRGVRLNNPCNIRLSSAPWQGKIVPSKDTAFEQFDTAVDGIRAGAKILVNYNQLDGLSTISQFIARWAPSDENDTGAYVSDVCAITAAQPDEPYDVLDAGKLGSLLTAIVHHENGYDPYDPQTVNQAVQEALENVIQATPEVDS